MYLVIEVRLVYVDVEQGAGEATTQGTQRNV